MLDIDEYKDLESTHYGDELPNTSELAKETGVSFNNPNSDLSENNIKSINAEGSELNKPKPSVATPKPKTPSIINVVLISAATSGTALIGTATLLTNPTFDVSLFSRTSSSLVFEINQLNVSEDDMIIASLSYESEIISEYEVGKERFVPFYDLLESSEYLFELYYYEDYFAIDSEGNPTYDFDNASPKLKFSSTYSTSNYSEEIGIEVISYSHELMQFEVYNSTNLPYVTTRVVTESNDVLFANDSSEEVISCEVSDIPYDQIIYITVKYGDRGLNYQMLEAIPSLENTSESEPNPLVINLSESYSTYDSFGVIMTIDDYNRKDEITSITVDDEIYLDYEINQDETRGIFSIHLENLEPESGHVITIYSQWDIIYQETFYTDYLVSTLYKDNEFSVNFSESFMVVVNQDPSITYTFDIHNSDDESMIGSVISEQAYTFQELEFYNGDYSIVIMKYMPEDQNGELVYSKVFTIDNGLMTPLFNVNQMDSFVSYHSLSVNFSLEDLEYINDVKVKFDDEDYDVDITSDGLFSVNKDDLIPESAHSIAIYDSNDTEVFFNYYYLDALVSISQNSSNSLSLSFNETFLSDISENTENEMYYYSIVDKNGVIIVQSEFNEDNQTELEDLYLFNEFYTFELYKFEVEQETETLVYSKEFELFNALEERPSFMVSVDDNKILTITYLSGDFPVSEFSDDITYSVRVYLENEEYDVTFYMIDFSSDNPTTSLSLITGTFEDDSYYSNEYEVNNGTYQLEIIYNYYSFYLDTFTIG